VVAAAAAVAIVIASAGGPGEPVAPPPWESHPNKAADPPAVAEAPQPPPPKPAAPAGPPADAAALAVAVKAARGPVQLKPGGEYDLTTLADPLVVRGDHFELIGDANQPARIKVAPHRTGGDPRAGALVLDGLKSAAFTGVTFEFAADDGGDVDDAPSAAVFATDVAELKFTDCQFRPDRRRPKLAAVGVSRRGGAVSVGLERCLFLPGATGVRVAGRAAVTVFDSAFGPHDAAIRVKPGDPVTVSLERSSFALGGGGAVVGVDADATAKVTAGYCVFGPDGGPVAADETPVLMKAAGPRAEPSTFAAVPGQKNVAFGVDAGDADPETVVPLKKSPWENPDVAGGLGADPPQAAFQLNVDGDDVVREVFTDEPTGFAVVGAQFARGNVRLAYTRFRGGSGTWPPQKPDPPAREMKQKVWWPNPPTDVPLPAGAYDNLVKLLQDLRSGDEVLVKHTGPVDVDPVEFSPPGADRGNFQVTFRAAPGFFPVLQLTPLNRKLYPSLFRLMDGRVAFKRLEFRLRASSAQSLAAVTVVGARECVFEECVFTLGDEAKAAAVQLADPMNEMAMATAGGRPVPDVQFRRCLIRGRGRGVWVAGSRPFNLSATGTVAALDGPLLAVDHASREPNGSEHAQFQLTNVTLLGGPVVEAHAGRIGEAGTSGLVPLEVTAENCLFAAVPGAARPLLDLTGLAPADVGRGGDRVTWTSRGAVRYANFDPAAVFAVFHPRADDADTPPKTWEWNPWASFSGDTHYQLGRVTFRLPPAGVRELRAVKPDDLRATIDFPMLTDPKPDDAGAPLKDVPAPRPEE
jgi:hypothetical protein